jgi:hypothetical protein
MFHNPTMNSLVAIRPPSKNKMGWNFYFILFSLGDLVATRSFNVGLQVVTI